MAIPTMPRWQILSAIRDGRSLEACVRRDEVLPLLHEATGRAYAASAAKSKRAIRARAPNGVRVVVTWLWDFAYVFVIPGDLEKRLRQAEHGVAPAREAA